MVAITSDCQTFQAWADDQHFAHKLQPARRGSRTRCGRIRFLGGRFVKQGHRRRVGAVARRIAIIAGYTSPHKRPSRLFEAMWDARNTNVWVFCRKFAHTGSGVHPSAACLKPIRHWPGFARRIPSSTICRLQLRRNRHGGSGSRGNTHAPIRRPSAAESAR